MSEKCVWISSPGTSLIFSRAELHFPALPVHTEPAGSNPIRCSHRLSYRIGLLASSSSMTYSIQLLLSAHSLASPLMFPWSKALGLSCTCSLSKWFTKTVCFLRKSSEPVRKEMANHANQRGRVRHIRNYISAVIPQITWFELVCFPGNPSSFRHLFFLRRNGGRFDSLIATEAIQQKGQLSLIGQRYTELLNIHRQTSRENMEVILIMTFPLGIPPKYLM